MKAITLTQPWATLVAFGAKKIETRSWATDYRGPLAIHAAKSIPTWVDYWAISVLPILSRYRALPIQSLPRGCVVATCTLVDVVPAARARPDAAERTLGDFAPGRFAWLLADVRPLPVPVPARGSLGLWEWDGNLLL